MENIEAKLSFNENQPEQAFSIQQDYFEIPNNEKLKDEENQKPILNTEVNREESPQNIDNKAEIFELADWDDALKVARKTMVLQLKQRPKEEDDILSQATEDIMEGSMISRRMSLEFEKLESQSPIQIIDNFFKVEKSEQPQQITPPITTENKPKEEAKAEKVDKEKESPKTKNLASSFKSMLQTTMKNFRGRQHEENIPGKEGFLKKRSPSFLHFWQVRYIVLKDRKLFYFRDSGRDRPAGCLDFDLFSAKLEILPKDPKVFMIKPIGISRVFTFMAENEQEGREWVQALRAHIQASAGSKYLLQSIVAKKHFWKYERMTENKFLQFASTGDLLLFKTKNFVAKILRKVTRSQYDHVAMILKYDREIVLLEATGQSGVSLCKWSSFKANNFHILYSKTVYRKLTMERTPEVIEKIENFAKGTVGKKYGLSASKLLIKTEQDTQTELTAEDRTYFCSELIAACYKNINILPSTVAASSFYPSTFGSDKKLTLQGGAKLENEILIDFNLD